MGRLLLRVLLFMSPFIGAYTLTLWLAYHAGESVPVAMLVERQTAGETFLFGRSGIDDTYAYKLLSGIAHEPDIMVLGSSRGMAVRAEFFTRTVADFYNASSSAANLSALRDYLERYVASGAQFPDLVILVLDQIRFVGVDDVLAFQFTAVDRLITPPPDAIFGSQNSMLQQMASGEVSLAQLLTRRDPVYGGLAYGVDAIRFGRGFRPDGSLQEGRLLLDPSQVVIAQQSHLDRIDRREIDFVRQSAEGSYLILEDILNLVEAHGGTAIGYMPPYLPELYERITNMGSMPRIQMIATRIDAMFAKRGWRFFNFTDPATANLAAGEFADGWHPSELANLKMLIMMVEAAPEVFAPYTDVELLREMAANAPSPFDVLNSERLGS
jgi:hypothetical protein